MLSAIDEKLYICPGETHPISRSVHLSRLAAFFPACRNCPYREDTGQIPAKTVERLQETEKRIRRRSLLTVEGIRGVYLNELDRRRAGQYAAALACLLWDQAPPRSPSPPSPLPEGEGGGVRADNPGFWPEERPRGPARRPAVVVGYDERPSSPDLAVGVTQALQRMGCRVIDIGLATSPGLWFSVDHLEATAGVFVTGSGCDQGWTGMDVVGKQALPLSRLAESDSPRDDFPDDELSLNRLEERLERPISRQTRRSGPQRSFQGYVPYKAGLWRHFREAGPRKVVLASPSPLVRRTLTEIFQTLPCELLAVELPKRARDLAQADVRDVPRLADTVREENADFGILINDDARQCLFLDKAGRAVGSREITLLLARRLLADSPGRAIILEETAWELEAEITAAGGSCHASGTTMQEFSGAMRQHEAIFGGGNSGRFWFRDPFPTCDAIVVLAKVLSILSGGNASLGELTR